MNNTAMDHELPYFIYNPAALPPESKDAMSQIQDNLQSMRGHVQRFIHCVELLERSKSEMQEAKRIRDEKGGEHTWENAENYRYHTRVYDTLCERLISWQSIAQNQASMELSHYAKLMGHTKQIINKSPSINKLIGEDRITGLSTDFYKSFPDVWGVRNPNAHKGDFRGSERKRRTNSTSEAFEVPGVTSKGENTFVSESSDVKNLSYTYGGKVYTLEVSERSVSKLVNNLRLHYDTIDITN